METDLRLESSLWVGNKRYRAVLTGWHFNWTEVDKKNRDKKTSRWLLTLIWLMTNLSLGNKRRQHFSWSLTRRRDEFTELLAKKREEQVKQHEREAQPPETADWKHRLHRSHTPPDTHWYQAWPWTVSLCVVSTLKSKNVHRPLLK